MTTTAERPGAPSESLLARHPLVLVLRKKELLPK
jgi:hypothetical protein